MGHIYLFCWTFASSSLFVRPFRRDQNPETPCRFVTVSYCTPALGQSGAHTLKHALPHSGLVGGLHACTVDHLVSIFSLSAVDSSDCQLNKGLHSVDE